MKKNRFELIDTFFHPKNVTLIGVSRKTISASGMILTNIIRGKYEGPLNLINKNTKPGTKILGKPIKNSLDEIDTDL